MKLAVVVPRYGVGVSGGAEQAARLLSEALVARRGWDVEVLTTTAVDTDWNDGFAVGTERLGGVTVRRFAVAGRRARDFDERSRRLLAAPRRGRDRDEEAWLRAQGPTSPDLIEAIAATEADAIGFHPYLYHPTIAGMRAARRPTILHGAAHDEPALALRMVRASYEGADALTFWSDAERALVLDRFAVGAIPQVVTGLGVEPGTGGEHTAREAIGLGDRPYVLCVGRVDDGKGARLLTELFAAYAARRADDVTLVFAGAVVHAPAAHDRIIVAGAVDESVKWGLLRGARALVSPSAFESFGIVLTEAWSVGTPVVVNARCAVTSAHVRAARGGFTFADAAEFSAALDRLFDDDRVARALGSAGQQHTLAHFLWDPVLDRYGRLVSHIAS